MPCAVILTAIPIEYQAVRSHLTQLLEVMHPQGKIYERGKFLTEGKIWDIGIVETGAGNSPAGIEAERAIAFFKPDVILFVGVAGGIKDVKLGDVVAGTKVYGYESGKLEGEKFKPRPNVGESSYNLVQRARVEGRKNDWLERVSIQSDLNPTVFVAPIVAGEKVVADVKSDLFQFLRDNYGDGLAVEMEGRGVLQAAYANQQVSALIIRGISDLIEGKSEADKRGFQEIAAHHASAFAFQILAKFEPSGTMKDVNQPPEETIANTNQTHSGSGDNVGRDVNINYNFQGATFSGGFAGRDYTGDVVNYPKNINDNSKQNIKLLQVLIDYFSHREKPGQHLKALIAISQIQIDTAGIDYNLPVRELITSFYVELITNQENYLSFLKVFQSQLPRYSDEISFINDLIQNAENATSENNPETSPINQPQKKPKTASIFDNLNVSQSHNPSPTKSMSNNSDYQYDVFISYSSKDRPWVKELLRLLEQQGLKACIDYRDFVIGMPSIKNIENSVLNSKKTLLILTPNYLQSGWTEFEHILLQTLDPANQKLRLIPLLKEKCALPLRLKALTYLDFANPEDEAEEWQRLVNALGKPSMSDNPTNTNTQEATDSLIKNSKKTNFFAYDQAWVGRENLINKLTNQVTSSCRLLILVGITGIGKTALGERLAVGLENWFLEWNYYLQENFDNEEQTSDFGSVAARLLEKCGEVITPDDRKDTQRLMNRLVKYLQDNRYLIQIDSLENLLQGNEEEGWSDFKDEWWVQFFQTWLNVDSCESCFILTSQDLPAQIPTIGTRSQNFWYCQPLSGLDEPEQLQLFNKTGLDVSQEAKGKPYLERIGRAYEGHPLALRVIAGEIVNHPFNGNVLGYWKKYGKEVEEVEKAVEEAKTKGITASADDQFNLHQYTRNLRQNVKVRLEKAFSRLHEKVREAYLLLCESSVYRCEVPEDFWLSHLEDWDIDEEGQKKALEALKDRYLVEERIDENNQFLLRQHNLIRSVSLEHLRALD